MINLDAKVPTKAGVVIAAEIQRNQSLHANRLNTKQLFADMSEVLIEHFNETYVLRITKQNKLILTK